MLSLFGNRPPPWPPTPPRNALMDFLHPNHMAPRTLANALMNWDTRPKTEWVPGYHRRVPLGLMGYTYEWVPGYWRRRAW